MQRWFHVIVRKQNKAKNRIVNNKFIKTLETEPFEKAINPPARFGKNGLINEGIN